MSRELARLGEFGLIPRLAKLCPTRSPRLRLGVGDDAAVLTPSPRHDLLVTTDVLVEDVDFDRSVWSFDRLGEKALAVNLSDIAAMGGTPTAFFVALSMPPTASIRQAEDFYRGLGRAARRHRVVLGGGDLSAASVWSAAITLLGEVATGRAVTRSGARTGDRLCVTGTLGDAAAGLDLLKRIGAVRLARHRRFLIDRHQIPEPRLVLGRALGDRKLVTAAIDLSDGLASDLRRLCEAGGVGAEIELTALPLSPALRDYAAGFQDDPAERALTGGEDFELLIAVRPADLPGVLRLSTARVPITPIGRVLPRRAGIRLIDGTGARRPMTARGYDHFKG